MSLDEGKAVTKEVSYCRICPALCGIVADVSGDRRTVLRVRGDPDNPASKGFTCPKGRALPQEVHAPDRLRRSWRRGADGSKTVLSADDALDEIAERLPRSSLTMARDRSASTSAPEDMRRFPSPLPLRG